MMPLLSLCIGFGFRFRFGFGFEAGCVNVWFSMMIYDGRIG